MPWGKQGRPCEMCKGHANKLRFARRCEGCKTPRKKAMSPNSLANLNHGQPDLTAAQIEAMLTRLERPRWRA